MRALLVLGGTEIDFADKAAEVDTILCADSGADYALNQGVVPNAILGDMDSISDSTLNAFEKENVKIVRHPAEKDKTDGEISVDYAKELGVDELHIVCAEGSIDHYLGNLNLLLYAKELGVKAWLETKDMLVCASSDKVILRGEKGRRVSVMPAGRDILVLEKQGLYYELMQPTRIKAGQTYGLGNHMTGDECTIEILEGIAFIFIEKALDKKLN